VARPAANCFSGLLARPGPASILKACAKGGPACDLKNLHWPAQALVKLMDGIRQWQGYDD